MLTEVIAECVDERGVTRNVRGIHVLPVDLVPAKSMLHARLRKARVKAINIRGCPEYTSEEAPVPTGVQAPMRPRFISVKLVFNPHRNPLPRRKERDPGSL